MKIGKNNGSCCITKLVTIIMIAVICPNTVSGIWDFTRPTNNAAQAALGGIFLGAAAGLSLNYFKGRRGRRDITGNVRLFRLCIRLYLILPIA
jgi:hypothetical protein